MEKRMSNITIINPESRVYTEDAVLEFAFNPSLDSNIWAIQWDGTSGHIEYKDSTPNLTIDSIADYQYLLDAHATEKQRLEDEETDRVANMTYAEKRAAEYPPFEDQFDDIFHNGVDGWKATIQVTKDKYPKP